ncbi:hypothetical protein FRC01_006086, partial [Tulasnella sp. 417]
EALAWYDTAIAEWRKCGNVVELSKCLSASDAILMQSPLVDDIGSLIVSVSQDPIKINGHFCDLFEGVHTTAGRVALKRPRIGGTGYDAAVIRLYEAADAVSYLHDSKVIHGDIKGSNILINDSGKSLLCDFGLTRVTQSKTSTAMRGAGTVRWQSPELWEEDIPKSFGSDVYAFAMTIVEIITGDVPFAHIRNETSLIIAVMQKDERPLKAPLKSPSGMSYLNAWDVAEACWKKDPQDRMTMRAAFQRLRDDPSLSHSTATSMPQAKKTRRKDAQASTQLPTVPS